MVSTETEIITQPFKKILRLRQISPIEGCVIIYSHPLTWLKVHDKLYQWVRVAAGREPSPSEAAVDSQSVETATMISQDVGYDAGKQIHARKRHLSVDLLGLVLRVLVTSASVPERTGAKKVLKRVHCMGERVNRLHTIWMDAGYRGEEFMQWVMDMFRWIVEVVLRPLEKKGFVLLSTETEIITQPFKKILRLRQISPIEGCVIIYSHPLTKAMGCRKNFWLAQLV